MRDVHFEFPQDLLDRVNAAQHHPSRTPGTRYVFRVTHITPDDDDTDAFEEVDSGEEVDSEDEDPRKFTFDTIEEANRAALDLFTEYYEDFCTQREDMSNWYEEGTSKEELNEVVWRVNANGELSLEAHDTEDGHTYLVCVEALKVR
jgi:hypothetical protein